MAGLKPNDFNWIIEGKLAVSECIGGGGLTPRKIRREEAVSYTHLTLPTTVSV